MSGANILQTLDSLLKRRPSKRERKERAKQDVGFFIRRSSGSSKAKDVECAVSTGSVDSGRVKKAESETRREKNAATLRAADKLVTDRSKRLHGEILELMRAQKEHRNPRLKRKTKLSYFDFEDDNDS
ncbi:hypothetical protein GGI04_003012 [Coemansia thaxteri]|uniref:Uncharacterized protein n=1 Tax=Coemansia thaxteri TaxID=2663907 RepID=A0A9W8BJC6_9FUNG|nr:hypothetical protein H4R26_003270 [Coemansia thaxteri]KAJ2003301.1 hypothetical protein GGI04_003012 [Coemansia thaxteri]KAJ2471200.1 hypothetical protein GGI02_002425 [Coemansia sp. RSA 2322]KAJ2482571.1 hypothetical protein EV174_003168 [Coemansia sp. RSA 2320]